MNLDENKSLNFVTHLECSKTGKEYPSNKVIGLSEDNAPLLVKYDLNALSQSLDKKTLDQRPENLWRYKEFLPVREEINIVSLGESFTPLLHAPNLPGNHVYIKDEGRLPTGSFKARGLCMAVSMAKELGINKLAIPTNGNAGAAMAAYAKRAGIEAYVFCPDDTPEINIREIALQGASTWTVNGFITDCGKIVREGINSLNWFDVSTLKEPYRIEGKKTMGLELANQLNWQLPDVIMYPTGGGTGLIGMVKAFNELESIGWIGKKRPRMVAVQSTGCAPIVKAYDEGLEHAEYWENAETIASGIRVPAAIGDFLILRGIRETDGFATAVDDEAIVSAREEIADLEGILLCPEGAATYAAYLKELKTGRISLDDSVVLFNCATGLKYPMPEVVNHLDKDQPINYSSL
ncbi:MAG TPA: threonine synthase [Verrucomicrobia bacterium]|nr:threonine synthase [Verrucomicrobiales bacterium]HIL56244.1 threonine synthase [Verrucomicrobiota bacterium]